MKELPLSDQITLATVRISTALPENKKRIGTGFFYHAGRVEGLPLSLIVTNKHVVAGVGDVTFHTAVADSAGMPTVGGNDAITLGREVLDQVLVNHPDPEVDLCGVITWPFIAAMKQNGNRLSHRHLNESSVATPDEINEMSAIEDVILVGYPAGFWDQTNNRPIARRGITATHARLSYNGRAEFLIDAPSFPGQSGSPVFLYRPELHMKGEEFVITSLPRLIGVLAEAPVHTEEVSIHNAFALSDKGATAQFDLPLNLGTVLHARRVTELAVASQLRAASLRTDLLGNSSSAG